MASNLSTIIEVQTGLPLDSQESVMESITNSPVLAPKKLLVDNIFIEQNNVVPTQLNSRRGRLANEIFHIGARSP